MSHNSIIWVMHALRSITSLMYSTRPILKFMHAYLPRLTDFSQLLNKGEVDVFTTKLNLEPKLTLARHFYLRVIK